MNPIIEQYSSNNLTHATLLVGQSEEISRLVGEFCEALELNPADYFTVEPGTTIKINDARGTVKFATASRFTSPIKLIYLPEVANLTVEAANALLKIIEEPPKCTYFILSTTQPESLLPTIRSRCQTIYLKKGARGTLQQIPLNLSLAEYFALSSQLAASDQPLDKLLGEWLEELTVTSGHYPVSQLILKYLEYTKTNVGRRLLLDNLFLELYNLNHQP